MIKLNIGCGYNKLNGYLNVDKEATCQPDEVVDLEKPWPWKDNSIQEIRASHILEHLGQLTDVFLLIMKEMYRVCEDGAKIYIQVPHHDHWTFHSDPTHVRKIHPEGLKLFDQELNRFYQKNNYSNSSLGLYTKVDFVLESSVPSFDEPWATRIRNQQISSYDLEFASSHYTNVIVQWDIVLRVRKGKHL